MGLQLVRKDDRKCNFIILFIRNMVLFTGDFMLFFLPCITIFGKGEQSLIDKILKVKIVKCDRNEKVYIMSCI